MRPVISVRVPHTHKYLSAQVRALIPSPSQLLSSVIKVVQFLEARTSISVSGLPKDNKKALFGAEIKRKGLCSTENDEELQRETRQRDFTPPIPAKDGCRRSPPNKHWNFSPSQKRLVERCRGFTSPATRANYRHPELCIGAGVCVEPPLPAPCSPSCNSSSTEPQNSKSHPWARRALAPKATLRC